LRAADLPQKRHRAPKLLRGAIDMVERTSRPPLGATLGNQPDAMHRTPHLQGHFSMRPLRTALFLATALAAAPLTFIPVSPASAQIGIGVNITIAPPELPVYEQPPLPAEGWLWQPGFWAYGDEGYYWVPGTWVEPPQPGVLWTPGYWGFVGGYYGWHGGYWGPQVGFYGGVNYGFGYVGVGFVGGRWAGNSFAYNTAVNNVNVTVIHNTYNTTVVNNVTVNKVSYNGGAGGVVAVPTAQERAAAQQPHVPPTAVQRQHVQEAIRNPALSARANGGHPAIAATARPAVFSGPGVIGARGAPPPRTAAPPPRAAAAPPRAAEAGQPGAGRPAVAPPPAAIARPQAPRPAAPRPPPKKPPQQEKREPEHGH